MEEMRQEPWRRELDRLLTGPKGLTVACLLLFLVLALTVWGANYPSELLQGLFGWGYRLLSGLLRDWPGYLRGFVLDGMYTTGTYVLAVMLPPMVIFFFLFTMLENIGYLPRLARLLDKPLGCCGGCGRQGVTLCMGLGCNTVGIMGCRQIECPQRRLRGILTNAMVPCNGRFPLLIVLAGVLLPGWEAVGVMAFGFLGIIGAIAVSGLLSLFMKKPVCAESVVPLPPLKRPRMGYILQECLVSKPWELARTSFCVAAPVGGLLWGLTQTGILPRITQALEPLGAAMGLDGTLLTAFIMSFPANELFLPSLLLMTASPEPAFAWNTALCALVFTVFHWPCATTLITIYKETGSKKQTAAAWFLPTAVGVLLCILLNGLFQLLGS